MVTDGSGNKLSSLLADKATIFNTLGDLKNSTKLKDGDVAITLGYYSINDGGGGTYNVVSGNVQSDNGGSVIKLADNTLTALLITDGKRINVKQFGVKESSSSAGDCSSIIQNIITNTDFATLVFPKGQYYFSNTIQLTRYIQIIGDLNSTSIGVLIRTGAIEAFTTNDTEQRLVIKNIQFQSDNNNFSILFSRVRFTNSEFINITTVSYHVIFNGSIYQISKIEKCYWQTIRYAAFTNVFPSGYTQYQSAYSGITDSEINSNYFTGSHTERCHLFYQFRTNSSRFHSNYVDYFYCVWGTDYTVDGVNCAVFDGVVIQNNVIEYCFSIMKNVRISGLSFLNNLTRFINNTIVNANTFNYLTTTEKTSLFMAIRSFRANTTLIRNNQIVSCDTFLDFDIMDLNVNIGGNIYESVTNKVVFHDPYSYAGQGQLGCLIEELNNQVVANLPSANWGTGTYPGHTVIYNNKIYTNMNQKWYDSNGIVSTQGSLIDPLVKYLTVAASGNTYGLDLTNYYNFAIETTDTATKTITFSNVPATSNLLLSVSVKLKYTNAAALNYPTGTVWKDGTTPTLATGKQYILQFVSFDNGTSWLASFVGAW
jgi:hypothetical protein